MRGEIEQLAIRCGKAWAKNEEKDLRCHSVSFSPRIGVILDVLHTALSVIDEDSASRGGIQADDAA
jgi:hypothetical protein